jgi:hypothetical protein
MPNRAVQIQTGDSRIIAPCGLNCSLCRAYARDRNTCPGCRGGNSSKSKACIACAIKNCENLAAGGYQFCFSCFEYPCADLSRLDGRYKVKYGISAIANLNHIKSVGVEHFVIEEAATWACPECGSLLCMHKSRCTSCGFTRRRTECF